MSATPGIPPTNDRAPLSVLVVCSGNTCRSPMAEQVLRGAFADAGLADRVAVASAGTDVSEVGAAPSAGTVRVLAAAGRPSVHAAQPLTEQMLDSADLILAADRGQEAELLDRGVRPDSLALLRSFDPEATQDEIPDPYGLPDAAYRQVFEIITAATPGIVDEVRRRLSTLVSTNEHE